MNERYKEFSYEITDDPRFRDEENAMTEELRREQEKIYPLIMQGQVGNKIIDRLLKLIEKNPQNPQLKNYLSVAYKNKGNIKKAREVNEWILAEHPDYLFGKLNLAAQYFENKEYEKMPEVLGNMMEIQDLYPEREVFHLSEVTGFNRFAIMYFTAIGNYEAAESRYEILERIAPEHPDTQQALNYLLPGRLESGLKRMEEEEKTRISVSTRTGVDEVQTHRKPEFTHEEINLLYRHGLYIGRENLDKILALPRETLIEDLEKVLQDLKFRYEYFKTKEEADGWNEETTSFPIHAFYLLGELRAEESLEAVLDILRQGEAFLNFWFGDFLTDNLWEPLYFMAGNQTEKLKQLMVEPGVYTYVRSEIASLMGQIVLHEPERRVEVDSWFRSVLQHYLGCTPEQNVVDSDAIGLIICELMDIQAAELLPEIEKLFGLGYVSLGICGELKDVKEGLNDPSRYDTTKTLMDIAGRYEHITSTWAGYTENEEEETTYVPIEEPYIRTSPKIGRNDPCPCGSGKKYKKCCINKTN
jgi:tetratricopeptide (TPR) repeat protein